MLEKIKYIAAYQTQPVSAITHFAPVDRIEPYGEEGNTNLFFPKKRKALAPSPTETLPVVLCKGLAIRLLRS